LKPIRARQNAMVAGVLAMSRIKKAASPDFSRRNFKCFAFYGVSADLRRAVFHETTLWNADFYGMNLQGGDFSGARAFNANFQRADLTGAKFTQAEAALSDFTDATVDNADFTDAELDGADLTTAKGVTEPQLRKAKSLYCTKLEAKLVDSLKDRTPPPLGKRCPQ
jgi:uncharacterized protein YjbI with pentapeptide repeats